MLLLELKIIRTQVIVGIKKNQNTGYCWNKK